MAANYAYQVGGFAYQGDGQFAYQGNSGGGPTVTIDTHDGWKKTRRQEEEFKRKKEEFRAEVVAAFESVLEPHLAKVVAPYADNVTQEPTLTTLPHMNWDAMYEDREAIFAKIRQLREAQQEEDDIEAIFLLNG